MKLAALWLALFLSCSYRTWASTVTASVAESETAEETTPQNTKSETSSTEKVATEAKVPVQSGPLIDLFGPTLLKLEMLDETHARLQQNYTSDALRGKKVIGVYFSADWCGPCRQFTPELVSFYKKMNARRGKQHQFEIVWVSRCRDVNSFGQYFTHMGGWYALPPDEAMGQRGAMLSELYRVKGIPSLVLLDDLGTVITMDARNKIPQDKAGIGFPWRNPVTSLVSAIVPRSVRLMVQSQINAVKGKLLQRVKRVLGLQRQ
jgi:nucleoredoxin